MDYHEAANFLFGLQRFGPKPGPESTADLLAELGNPHEDVPAVQIAGSNGKGSTARMTESILREAGYSVGLFTSPHLDDFRERVRVDGRKIPKQAVGSFVEESREYITERGADGASPTFFEAVTALALWQFERANVDVAILEVGIGGKIDATSVVDPIASAVTTVTLEHTGLLGETVSEIAADKAHVAPDSRPLVTAATDDALATIREIAGDVITVQGGGDVVPTYEGRVNHSEAAVRIDANDSAGGWSVEGRMPTIGSYQAENAGVAVTLAHQVADELDEQQVDKAATARGLRKAYWPGRFEVVARDPMVVLDGAHNAGACERLAGAVDEYGYDDLHIVFGALHDKGHDAMASALPDAASVTVCEPDSDRAADAGVLARVFERNDSASVTMVEAVPDAVELALANASADDLVLVTGSLYTVGEARHRWRRTLLPKRIDSPAAAAAALEGAHVPEVEDVVAGSTVHRVVKTRLRRRQITTIDALFREVGGECIVSGTGERTDATADVLLSGTLTDFRALASALTDAPHGLGPFADELRRALRIDAETDSVSCGQLGNEEAGERPWTESPAIMGILNVTPDSFHDGGEYNRVDDAVARAESMVEQGAEIIDVGGESTRPGAEPVSVQDEIDRVVPVIEALDGIAAAISVDTRKAAVADEALAAGADIINDVSGLSDPAMRFVAAEHDAGLVVMHSINAPVDPSASPAYDDVVEDVVDELAEQVLLAEAAGVDRDRILVDPGLGFGKSAAESFELLDRLGELRALGCPIMVGHSHKSMFELAGYEHGDRYEPTVAGTTIAVERGADVIRVHDVPANVAAVAVAQCAAADDR